MGLAKSKKANKREQKQTSQTIDWNEDTNEEITGRHNESNYHLKSAIDYLQQHGYFEHQNHEIRIGTAYNKAMYYIIKNFTQNYSYDIVLTKWLTKI